MHDALLDPLRRSAAGTRTDALPCDSAAVVPGTGRSRVHLHSTPAGRRNKNQSAYPELLLYFKL